MHRSPWLNDNFAYDMAMSLLTMAGIDREKQRRLEQRICEATLERLDFKVLPVMKATERDPSDVVIVNAEGNPLSPEEKLKLEETYKEVKAWYKERIAAVKAEKEREAAEEAAAQKAAYDAAAAPYREERRRRKAEAWAKRQPKGAQNAEHGQV